MPLQGRDRRTISTDTMVSTEKQIEELGWTLSVWENGCAAYFRHFHTPWRQTPEEVTMRFVRGPKDECWNWNGAIGRDGYGFYHFKKAHRLSYEFHNGPIPDGLWVLHKCDNRRCVNPNHLFLGTNSDNIQDCITKGRFPVGERHSCAKLTRAEVLWCRKAHRDHGWNFSELGRAFGVSNQSMRSAVKGINWKHI